MYCSVKISDKKNTKYTKTLNFFDNFVFAGVQSFIVFVLSKMNAAHFRIPGHHSRTAEVVQLNVVLVPSLS